MILYYKFRAFLVTWALRLLPRNVPVVLQGLGSSERLCEHVALLGYTQVVIVTDKFLNDSGILDKVKASLTQNAVNFEIFEI